MSPAGIINDEFSPEDAEMIVSTRIRVARNLDGYPLCPGLTKDQRVEIMGKVQKACESLEGELKGQFSALEGLDEARKT